jgi:hypothetical protein
LAKLAAAPAKSESQSSIASMPDALIAWTTAIALVAFGIAFFDDAAIMGRTLLLMGLLCAGNEALKLAERRTGAPGRFRRLRMACAVLYLAFMLIGFLFPPAGR